MDDPTVEEAERALEETRNRLGWLLAELSRRRHRLADVKGQLTRNARPVVIAAASVALLAAGGVALAMRHSRRQRSLPARARHLGSALARLAAHPDRVARPAPSAGQRILQAALASLAAVAVKQLAQAGLARAR